MIVLEIQALAERRENLLIEIGRVVIASGFILQRQRLADERHGVLLTLVVRGPARKQRALAAAMDAHERVISFRIAVFEAGTQKPHFAASRVVAYKPAAPAPEPPVETAVIAAIAARQIDAPPTPDSLPAVAMPSALEYQEQTVSGFLLAAAQFPSPPPTTAPVIPPVEPFIELIPLGPDVDAVDRMLPRLINDYPQIFPRLQKLEHSVVEAARASSLLLAGRRLGASVFARDYRLHTQLGLLEAIERVGIPALDAIVQVDRHVEQLHIHDSPICTDQGRSGCIFFSGLLEGLLGPALASNTVSIFSVCCRSFGAGECVLAISD